MDRFIANKSISETEKKSNLKSSMDRFIVTSLMSIRLACSDLKSSMDRFIVRDDYGEHEVFGRFKIQYG